MVPQDVGIELKCEGHGKIVKITYVYVLIEQASSVGHGYVINGGIDEEFIEIRIESKNTLNFSYIARFYGY